MENESNVECHKISKKNALKTSEKKNENIRILILFDYIENSGPVKKGTKNTILLKL